MNRQQRRKMMKLGNAVNRMARSQCSECLSPSIRWCSPADLPFLVSLEFQQEAVTFTHTNAVTECWVCTDCGNFGGFGSLQSF